MIASATACCSGDNPAFRASSPNVFKPLNYLCTLAMSAWIFSSWLWISLRLRAKSRLAGSALRHIIMKNISCCNEQIEQRWAKDVRSVCGGDLVGGGAPDKSRRGERGRGRHDGGEQKCQDGETHDVRYGSVKDWVRRCSTEELCVCVWAAVVEMQGLPLK